MNRTAALALPCIALALGTSLGAQPKDAALFLITQNDKYGFMDRTGKVVISPQFENASDGFIEGMTRVQIGKQWTYMDQAGKVLDAKFEPPFAWADGRYHFADGLAVFRVGGKEKRLPDGYRYEIVDAKYGYIDLAGKTVLEAQFDDALPFWKGLAPAKKGAHWGFIDRTGKFVVPPQFDQVQQYGDGSPQVALDGQWGYVDSKGQVVIKPQFDRADGFYDGRATVESQGKLGVIDERGQLVVRMQFDYIGPFHEGMAVVRKDLRYKLTDKDGEEREIVEMRFGYLDKRGLAVALRFQSTGDFSEGLAPVQVAESLWGYVGKTGRFVINPQFTWANPFSEGLARVSAYPEQGFIDKTGHFAIKMKFDHAGDFQEGLAPVYFNSEGSDRGYIDKTGKIVWRSRDGKDK